MGWGDNTKGPWSSTPGGNKKPPQKKPSSTGSSGGGKGGKSGNNGGDDKIIDLDSFFKKAGGGGNGGDFSFGVKGLIGLIIAALIGWSLTGFYKVDASEEGVVLRFGKYHRTAPEGLRFHLPYPIEQVYIVKKTKINSVQIGYRSGAVQTSRFAGFGKKQVSREMKNTKESLMITGDTNIADVSFTVQWRIKDSLNYLFKISNPEETVKAVAESAMREVIGRSKFSEAMTIKRSEIEREVQNIIQMILDSYEAGIEIYTVNLNDVQNPAPVMPAFLDVETAKQDRETAINRARSYENDIIPKARGDAQKMIQDAEAYREQVISIATGEAQRFVQVFDEYRKAKDVTKRRIYLETMQEILDGMDKVIIGEKASSSVLPYLPLRELGKKN